MHVGVHNDSQEFSLTSLLHFLIPDQRKPILLKQIPVVIFFEVLNCLGRSMGRHRQVFVYGKIEDNLYFDKNWKKPVFKFLMQASN
jgi:hypothetical protein